MALSWNEIKKRSIEFSKEWENETSENAEAKSFWDGFFNVFGISRRRVATFEKPVKLLDEKTGYIDLLWKGVLIVEHKSRGKDLNKAFDQAKNYFPGIKEYELPKYVLVSDFSRFRLYNLETEQNNEFRLEDFHKHIHLFGFIAGYEKKEYKEEDPVNIKAAELMGLLHDQLSDSGYKGHELEVLLVRILFCLFSDDTGIFPKNSFTDYIQHRTREDGSDLGPALAHLFQILNTPENDRQKTLDEELMAFPYVNGKLYAENLRMADFDSDMRESLLKCCYFDWSKISPAIFGSLFQSVMDQEKRRNIGAHYTSEKNILKLIKPLFLDNLRAEFEKVKNSGRKLTEFHEKISAMRFLDPACGCGNFLVITYREMRKLEIDILKALNEHEHRILDISLLSKIDVDSMFGIEIEEFPARIAEVAMWLIDHQMNILMSEEFGQYYIRLPLKKSAKITLGNSLRLNWKDIIDPRKLSYIMGNPPFVGKQHRNEEQNTDMELIFGGSKGAGVLDYVTCWYIKAAEYIKDTGIKCAFVSTNSISQGEQTGILWNILFNKYGIKILFAHRTFQWTSEAKGKASVFVVIIGFAKNNVDGEKYIYEYDTPKSDAHVIKESNINPYLVEGNDLIILKRSKPINNVPEISFGNMPNDGGFLLLDDREKTGLIKNEPEAKTVIRPLISAREYLNGEKRWCIWLKDADPAIIRNVKAIKERVEKVKEYRLKAAVRPL